MNLLGLQEQQSPQDGSEVPIEGTYAFLSGELPPHGNVPVRYDIAHEMKITIGEQTVVIDLGIASEDGTSAQEGAGVVTPERIPMLFCKDGEFFNVVFERKNH